MTFDLDTHHRRSIRLLKFDYAADGAYLATLCIQGREWLFGRVVTGEMVLNEAGRMIEEVWQALPERFPAAQWDPFMVTPDHFHGILFLSGGRGESCGRPQGLTW